MATGAPRTFERVVVSGGAGFLGSHLCERLRAAGTEVVCLDNLISGSLENLAGLHGRPGFRFIDRDVSEPFTVAGPVDLVLHFASPASPTDYLRFPIETLTTGSAGTLHMLELAREKSARFVLASTSEVYGDPQVHPQREDYTGNVDPVGPRSVYFEAKRYAESLTTAFRARYGTGTAIARIFNTYGPRMRPFDGRAVPTFVRQALAGAPLTVSGDGTQTRSLCHVDDMVTGILALAASDHPGPMNLGGDEEMTVLALAQRIAALVGPGTSIRFVDRPADDPAKRRPDTSLAASVLGWKPRIGCDEGLRSVITWFAEGGGAPIPRAASDARPAPPVPQGRL